MWIFSCFLFFSIILITHVKAGFHKTYSLFMKPARKMDSAAIVQLAIVKLRNLLYNNADAEICLQFWIPKQHVNGVRYLCVVSDVKTNVFTVTDVAVFDCWTSTLAADTDSWPHWNKQDRDLLVHLHTFSKEISRGQNRNSSGIKGSLPVHVLRMMQWSMMGLQLTVISKQWCALWCWADLSSGLNCSGKKHCYQQPWAIVYSNLEGEDTCSLYIF